MKDFDKHLEKLQIEADLAMLNMEKLLDKMDKSIKRLNIFMYCFMTFVMLVSFSGVIGLYFPKLLNGYTLWCARTACIWAVFYGLSTILQTWKQNRKIDRDWRERIREREQKQMLLEEKELLEQKVSLKNEVDKLKN